MTRTASAPTFSASCALRTGRGMAEIVRALAGRGRRADRAQRVAGAARPRRHACTSRRASRPGRSSWRSSSRDAPRRCERRSATTRSPSATVRSRYSSRSRSRRSSRAVAGGVASDSGERELAAAAGRGIEDENLRKACCEERRYASLAKARLTAGGSGSTVGSPKSEDLQGFFNGRSELTQQRDITVLEGLEPVRLRPGMYIGSTGSARPPPPGLRGGRQLGRRGAWRAAPTWIEVTLHPDNSVTVSDNGSGIPTDVMHDQGLPAADGRADASCTPAASSAARATRSPAACTASASRS